MQVSAASQHSSASPGDVSAAPSFVINLSASTTPEALRHPSHPELKRFTFFVSRRREEGRERFRLHMGYFATQAEAEGLLALVREIYPGAWAGLAPGQNLKKRAAAEAAASLPPAPVLPVSAATLADIAPELSPPPEMAPPPEPQPLPARAVARHELPPPSLTLIVDEPRAARRLVAADETAAHSLSSLRKTIATLDDPATQLPQLQPPAVPGGATILSSAATLSLLEGGAHERPADVSASASASANANAALRREPACFAVQLMWSVQPIDMAALPQLAIFAAYTLYGAEGNRGGRRWYGLRLGFFTDAMSAKQVAQYVRSEFSSVSVVPVTGRERERARIAAAPRSPPPSRNQPSPRKQPTSELRLIDDNQAKLPTAALAARPGRGIAPGKRATLRPGAPHPPKPLLRKKPLTLEETLEILGAGDLQVDDGRTASINDSGVRHLRLEPVKARPSRLGRLIDRLAERIGSD